MDILCRHFVGGPGLGEPPCSLFADDCFKFKSLACNPRLSVSDGYIVQTFTHVHEMIVSLLQDQVKENLH